MGSKTNQVYYEIVSDYTAIPVGFKISSYISHAERDLSSISGSAHNLLLFTTTPSTSVLKNDHSFNKSKSII